MEKDWLTARLAEGWSIQRIADEAGKGASTVAYWIDKHGLVAAGRERHAPKGGGDAAILRELVDCVLLCGNCHAEVEAGVTRLPFRPTEAPS